MGPAQVSLGAEVGLLWHSTYPPAAQRDDPGRRRGGRELPQLRQHVVRAAGAVLRRPAVVTHHRLAWRADAALPAGAADARGGAKPDLHRRRPHRQGGRRRDGVWRHLGADPGWSVLRPRRHQDARQDRARSLLRRCRAGAHRLPGMRLLYDGLSPRCQEHPGEKLPWPRGISWRASDSDDHGEGV